MFPHCIAGIEVHVDALEDLPHGFLNFVLVSQDAWNGSEVCVTRLKEILILEEEKEEEEDGLALPHL